MSTYHLSKNPDSYQKCLNEATQILQDQDSLQYEDVDKMKYTLAVLKEVLRHSNPAYAVVGRKALRDHNLKDIKIKKNSRVTFFTCINSLKPGFLENPDDFQPERWLPENENNANWKKEPYLYVPFSVGPKNCPGQHFGLLQGRIVLGMFLKKFEIGLPENYKLMMTANFLYEPVDPIQLKLKPKTQSFNASSSSHIDEASNVRKASLDSESTQAESGIGSETDISSIRKNSNDTEIVKTVGKRTYCYEQRQ